MQAAIWVFSFFFSPLNFMDSTSKIADLGEFWVTKSEALRDTIPLYTVKFQKSIYLPLKTGHLQCVLSMTTSAICLCLADGRVSAEVWLSDQLLGDVSHWAEVAPVFVFISSACCTTDFSLLLVQAPPLGCPVPQQNQQGMLLNFTGAVDTSRVLWDWRSEIWNPEVVHSRSCLQDVSFQHWYASLQ